MTADLILEWHHPEGETHRHRVRAGEVCEIGRHPRCAIIAIEPSLSRRHTRVACVDGEWVVEDLGSSNGTYLDNARVERAPLTPGATLRCGDLKFETRWVYSPQEDGLPMVPLTRGSSAGAATLTRVDLDRGATHLLDPTEVTSLGRRDPSDVVIDATGVAMRHAVIRCLSEHWVIDEVDPLSKVRVNEQRVRSAVLGPGDEIRIGEAVLRFDLLASRPPRSPQSPQSPPPEALEGAATQRRDTPPLSLGPSRSRSTESSGTLAVRPKIVLLAFANDRVDSPGTYLRNLAAERRELSDALAAVAHHHRCRVVSEPEVTTARLFDLLDRHGEDIVALHYGGHGTPDALHFEDDDGALTPLWIDGLAQRLARLPALGLVVLNGCATAGMVKALHACTRACVIATDGAIDDAAARAFARRLWRALAWGEALGDAFDAAESEGRARFDALVQAWRMLSPNDAPSGWPWRLCPHPDAGESVGWRLSDRPAGVPADPEDARIVIDDVFIDRRDGGTVWLELRVRNIGRRVATLNRLRGRPLIGERPSLAVPPRAAMVPVEAPEGASPPMGSGSSDRHLIPAAMEPLHDPAWGDGDPPRAAMRSLALDRLLRFLARVGRALLRALTMGRVPRSPEPPPASSARGAGVPPAPLQRLTDGTHEVSLARYVPAGDYDRFLVEITLDEPCERLGVAVVYNGGYVALGPTVDLDG